MICDVKEVRPRATKLCYLQTSPRLELAKTLQSVAHCAKCVIRGTEGYVPAWSEFSLHYRFEWLYNLARSINRQFCDGHEHGVQYYPSFHEITSHWVDGAALQIVQPGVTTLCSWLALPDAGIKTVLTFIRIK